MTIRTKLLTPHNADCVAMRYVADGRWKTPWAYINESGFYGDKLGGARGSTTRWCTADCNDPNCDAKIAFSDLDVLLMLPTDAPAAPNGGERG